MSNTSKYNDELMSEPLPPLLSHTLSKDTTELDREKCNKWKERMNCMNEIKRKLKYMDEN